MWPTSRPWLALALLAFVLRAAVAVVATRGALPAHHFNDARQIEEWGWKAARESAESGSLRLVGAPSQRLMTAGVAALYRVVGRRPLALSLAVSAASALSIVALWFAFARAFDARTAAFAALAAALWPSSVFYGSQLLKDTLIAPALHGGLALALVAPGAAAVALATLSLCSAGLLRGAMLLPTWGALVAGAVTAVRSDRRRAAAWLAIAAASGLALRGASHLFFVRMLPVDSVYAEDPSYKREIIPTYYDAEAKASVRPWSPKALERFRRYRQEHDQAWSLQMTGRRIETQIYPGYPLDGWFDLALFLPKVAFVALFAPLPGLAPLESKPLRLAAAAENAFLLLVTALAALSLRHGLPSPERVILLAFFAACAAGAAPLEFDLGSASRHKVLYFPFLFPFALEELARLRRRA